MDLIVGWKDICKECGNLDKRTIKRWVDKYGFPLFYAQGRPMIHRESLSKWAQSMPERTDIQEVTS